MLQFARGGSPILLDFLAPSLLARSASTAALGAAAGPSFPQRRRPPVTHLQSPSTYFDDKFNPALLQNLKDKIVHRHHSVSKDFTDEKSLAFNGILLRLRIALGRESEFQLHRCLFDVFEQDFFHVLSLEMVQKISVMVNKSLHPSRDLLQGDDRLLVERFAVAAAQVEVRSTLVECMLRHLKRRDTGAVLRLYEQYSAVAMDREVEIEEEADEEEEILSSDAVIPFSPPAHSPEQIQILLLAATAHAIHDEFRSALQLCLDTPVRLLHFTIQEFLQKLGFLPLVLRKKIELYSQRMEVAKLVSRPPSLSKHVVNLSKGQASIQITKLYNKIIDGIEGSEPFIAADPSMMTESTPVAMNYVVWTTFLTSFLRLKETAMAEKMWDDMVRIGAPLGVTLWTALLDGQNGARQAIHTWDMMRQAGVAPEALTYRALLSALFRGRLYAEAMQILKEFEEKVLSSTELGLQLAVYNTVIQGLLQMGRVSEANTLFQRITDNGPKPDVICYNTFLAHHLKHLDLKGSAATIKQMTTARVQGDVVTFSTILSTLFRLGRGDAAEMVISLMRKQGVEANTVTYTALMKHQLRAGRDEKSVQAALSLLQKMENDPQCPPNQITYTTLISGVTVSLVPEKRRATIRFLVDAMKRRQVTMDSRTYTVLIKSGMDTMDKEGMTEALNYFEEMTSSDVSPTSATWYFLLSGLVRLKEWGRASEMLSRLHASGMQYDKAVEDLVRKIRARTVNRI
ncbi:hypothetical protein C8J56DRAFT_918617 [Mycena floridula]|nr:hypothetical protein C8J56DRAFT_918617 [Mycena floridula]